VSRVLEHKSDSHVLFCDEPVLVVQHFDLDVFHVDSSLELHTFLVEFSHDVLRFLNDRLPGVKLLL